MNTPVPLGEEPSILNTIKSKDTSGRRFIFLSQHNLIWCLGASLFPLWLAVGTQPWDGCLRPGDSSGALCAAYLFALTKIKCYSYLPVQLIAPAPVLLEVQGKTGSGLYFGICTLSSQREEWYSLASSSLLPLPQQWVTFSRHHLTPPGKNVLV